MRIEERHPLAGKLIEIRSRNLGLGIQRPNVAVAHVVSHNDDDVGRFGESGKCEYSG
jgi:hypothetical protein